MPDQLTRERAPRAEWLVPALTQAAIVLLVFAGAGVVAGAVWEWLWTPPVGVVIDGEWLLGLAALRSEFSATGLYVLVASAAGLVTGALCGLLLDRSELVTLAAGLVGAALAGWVMVQVGHALGPADPRELAQAAADRTRLPSDLRITGTSPYIAFPAGATLGLAVLFLGLTRRQAD